MEGDKPQTGGLKRPAKIKLSDTSKEAPPVEEHNVLKGDNIKIDEHGLSISQQRRDVGPGAKAGVPEKLELQMSAEDFESAGEELGKGASGVVYKMLYKPNGKHLAVKKISAINDKEKQLLFSELTTLANCRHENVISCVGAYYSGGHVFVAMDFMDLGTLSDLFTETVTIKEQILGNIAYQVLSGLDYLHRSMKLVHRDIKPANILINSEGYVKVADFGVGGNLLNTMDQKSTFVGTGIYMSPERFEGLNYGSNSDIWSVGISLLECAVGYFPYNKKREPLQYWNFYELVKNGPPPQAPETFTADFRDFIAKCLIKDPAQRPSAKTLLDHPFVLASKTFPKDKFAQFIKLQAALAKKSRK